MIALLALLQAAPGLAAQGLAERFPAPPEPPVCSVTLNVSVDEAGDPPEQQVYRYDAGADAWSYVSYNGGPPPEEEREQFEERGRDGGDRSDEPVLPAAFYADAAAKLGPGWTRLTEPDAYGMTLYGIEDLPKGTVVANGRDLSGYIRLRYLIDGSGPVPLIAVSGGQLKRDWRIPLIARISAFDIERRFAPAEADTGAPGAMLPLSEHVEIAANILGRDRSAVIDTTFTDWDCAPGEALAEGPAEDAR